MGQKLQRSQELWLESPAAVLCPVVGVGALVTVGTKRYNYGGREVGEL